MTNKSNQNGGKGRKKAVKQQPSQTDLIREQRKLAEEQSRLVNEHLKQANENLKRANERLQNVQEHRKITLIKRLEQLTSAPTSDYDEILRVTIELQKLYGIKPEPKPNHCKTCIFQKMCDKFTTDGRNGLACSYALSSKPTFDKVQKDCKRKREEDGPTRDKYDSHYISFTTSLVFWNDTQEQLNKRFILS